ncbi:MAG: hypothetical protein ABIC95_02155 [archaeon]
MQTLKHSPTLNTIRMVEGTLKDAEESLLTIAKLKILLPKQINHNTLRTILEYLEESDKIAVTMRGITWIQNTDSRLKEAIQASR